MCLGGAYILSYLVRSGLSARYFLSGKPVSVGECAARLAAMKPGSVGFTVDRSNYRFCRLIAAALKKAAPGTVIIFGGVIPSLYPGMTLTNNVFVDICSRNESEETCLQLISRLDDANFDMKRASLEKVKGITYRIGADIFTTPDRNVILENSRVPGFLDKYPSPYLEGIADSPGMGIITARGCDRHCAFCICPVMSKGVVATHSIDRVIAELDVISTCMVRDKTPVIDIFDDTFTLLPGRALEICRRIMENKIKLPLACTTRCDRVDEELLAAMKEAGFKAIEFSLESAVPRLLRKIGKVRHPDTKEDPGFEKEREFVDKFKKYVVHAKKIGIENVYASIMTGLPTETPAEGRQTVNLLRSLGGRIDYYGHNVFRAYPGTPIFSHGEDCGPPPSYDTGGVPLAPRSNVEIDGISRDKGSLKSLAFLLSLSNKENFRADRPYFNTVILLSDTVTKELILWLQENLALNGSLIQVYTSFEKAKQHYHLNEETFIAHGVPTNYRTGYYREYKDNGVITLMPFRTYLYEKQCGIPIDLVETGTGLSCSSFRSICIDKEKEDVLALHRCLTGLSFDHFFDTPVYPYMSSLCRWEKTLPNCRVLETVVVDAQNNVKTCWNGPPVGKVGMPLKEIMKNLKDMHREMDEKRGCAGCNKKSQCARCIFPQPLSVEEYCGLKKEFNTEEPAALIRTLDFIKELKGSDPVMQHV